MTPELDDLSSLTTEVVRAMPTSTIVLIFGIISARFGQLLADGGPKKIRERTLQSLLPIVDAGSMSSEQAEAIADATYIEHTRIDANIRKGMAILGPELNRRVPVPKEETSG